MSKLKISRKELYKIEEVPLKQEITESALFVSTFDFVVSANNHIGWIH